MHARRGDAAGSKPPTTTCSESQHVYTAGRLDTTNFVLFSRAERDSMTRRSQPRHRILISAPTRMTSQSDPPHGWTFLSLTMSPSPRSSSNPDPPVKGALHQKSHCGAVVRQAHHERRFPHPFVPSRGQRPRIEGSSPEGAYRGKLVEGQLALHDTSCAKPVKGEDRGVSLQKAVLRRALRVCPRALPIATEQAP